MATAKSSASKVAKHKPSAPRKAAATKVARKPLVKAKSTKPVPAKLPPKPTASVPVAAKPAPTPKPMSTPLAQPVPAASSEKLDKGKKLKLVRDSFTIPKMEYVVLDELKQRTARSGSPAKKSELLRAGIKLLAGLDDARLRLALSAVPAIKTGRPAKD